MTDKEKDTLNEEVITLKSSTENTDKLKGSKKTKKSKKKAKKITANNNELIEDIQSSNRPLVLNPFLVTSSGKYYLGLLARALSVAFCAFALLYFTLDTIDILYMTNTWFLLAISIFFTVPLVFSTQNKWAVALTVVAFIGCGAYLFIVKGVSLMDIVLIGTNIVDFTFERLADSGFDMFLGMSTGFGLIETPEETVKYIAVGLGLVYSLIYSLSFGKRSSIYVPILLNVLIVAPTFICNIANTNWGTAFVAVSYCVIAVLFVTDRLFEDMSNPRRFDTETVLNPAFVIGVDAPLTEDKKAAKEKKKQNKKKQQVLLDDELDDLLGGAPQKKKKAKGTKLTSDDKKRIRREKHTMHLKKYAKSAVAGFSAFAILLVGYFAIIVPAGIVEKNFKKIQFIDKNMSELRDYITALLLGDSLTLDLKSYENSSSNFGPHNTDLTPRQYLYEPRFYVEVQRLMPVYLRGWVSNSYKDGSWYIDPDHPSYDDYRKNFGVREDVHESLLDTFLKYMNPNGYDDSLNYLTQYTNNERYGYITMQVNIVRYFGGSTSLYVPSFINSKYGLRTFRSVYANEEMTYSNFFDGIYTSRNSKAGAAYGMVANIPTMTNENYAESISSLISEHNIQIDYIMHSIKYPYEPYYCKVGDSSTDIEIETDASEDADGDMGLIVDTKQITGITPLGFPYTVSYALEVTDSGTKDIKTIIVNGEYGDYVYKYDPYTGDLVSQDIANPKIDPATGRQYLYAPPTLELAVRYYHTCTGEQRGEITAYIDKLADYTDYVKRNYIETSGSEIIEEFAAQFKDLLTLTSTPGAEFTADKYLEIHNLILAITAYMGENYKYTLTPSSMGDPALTGVDNFIANVKEGYCVQFASTLALTLRELGIPTRYVEGYVASDFKKNQLYSYNDSYNVDTFEGGARYYTTVLDSNEHAWIEVWFDGIGWVQYEATPSMYTSYYPDDGSGDEPVETDPIIPDQTTDPDPSVTDPAQTTDPVDTESGDPTDTSEPVGPVISEDTVRLMIATAVIILLIVAVILIVRRARSADAARKQYIKDACEVNGEMQQKQFSESLSARIFELLGIYEMSPNTGELPDEFRVRLAREVIKLTAVTGQEAELTESYDASGEPEEDQYDGENAEPEVIEPTDTEIMATDEYRTVDAAMEALEAEEFGNGMSKNQLTAAAECYEMLLSVRKKKKLGFFKTIFYRYILNKV